MRRLTRTSTRIYALRRAKPRPRWVKPLCIALGVAILLGGILPALWISYGQSHVVPMLAAADHVVEETTGEAGLVVRKLSSDGRVRTSVDELRTVLDGLRGANILTVDIDHARRRIEELPWVKSATIQRRLPDTLHVSLVEREPLALAEADGGRLVLIDEDGQVVNMTDLQPFADLPTVAGEGAQRHAGELLALIRSEPSLYARVSGARRVGDRRWNVWMDGRVEVKLPEQGAAEAWHRLAVVQADDGLLDKAVVALDLRAIGGIVVRADPRALGDGKEGA